MKALKYPPLLEEIKDHLGKNAPTIFEKAIKNKSISTDQIIELIAPKHRSGRKLEQAMSLLTEIFVSQGIFVTYNPSKHGTNIEGIKDLVIPTNDTVPTNLTYSGKYDLKAKIKTIDESVIVEDESSIQWIKEQMDHKVLDKETVYELIKLAQNGSINARNAIIVHNQRLVRMVASKFYLCKILELGDLIQEGTFGLIRAIKKFDLSLNMSFSTYAFRWIQQFIYRAIADYDDVIRLPVHMQELLRKSRKALERAMQDEDLAPQIDQNLIWYGISPVSLDKESALNDESSLSLHDTLPDTRDIVGEIRMESAAELVKRTKNIENLVIEVTRLLLTERQKKMFFMRYGLNGEERHKTLESIGIIFDITRERVRQIIKKIWESLESRSHQLVINNEETIEQELKVIFALEKLTHQRAKL